MIRGKAARRLLFFLAVGATGVWRRTRRDVGAIAVSHFAGFATLLVGSIVFIAMRWRRPATAGGPARIRRGGDRFQSQRERQWLRVRGKASGRLATRVGRTPEAGRCRRHGLDEGSRLCASCEVFVLPSRPPNDRQRPIGGGRCCGLEFGARCVVRLLWQQVR